nr:retrotransposon protein, putative, Ty1-copia subclass [Tanacetum cinerariifolium]
KKYQPKVTKPKKVEHQKSLATPKPRKGQLCDSDLKVAFRINACFVRNLEGVDLLKGDRSTNLYTINLHEMVSASPICLMARASSTKSWLWHQRISVLLQSPVIIIRTDNGTEFKNQVLKEYFDTVGISHQMSSVRTPQQNGVVERQNRTYFADSCAYRVYNRRTKKIMKTMNVSIDELFAMAFEQRGLKPGLNSMTSGHISSGLDLTYAPLTITLQQPSDGELNLLFEAMYDDYISGQPSATARTVPPAQEPQVRQMSTASTTIADTASIPTNSSYLATNIPITSQDVDELNPNAMVDGNTFVNLFANPSTSAATASSSQQNVDPSNMHTYGNDKVIINVDDVPAAGIVDEGATSVVVDEVPAAVEEPSIPSSTPPTQSPPPSQDLPSTSQVQPKGIIANIDADEDVNLQYVDDIAKEVAVAAKIEEKPAELQEVVEVVTIAKLMTKVVTAASATITGADIIITTATSTLTTTPSASRRRKGVVIRDPEETATPSTIIHTKPKSKDKGKGIMVYEPKPLKKKTRIEQDEAYVRELEAELNKNIDWDEMDYFKGMSYDDIRLIFEKKFNSNVSFLVKTKEQMEEEDSRALKRKVKSSEDKAAKKKKLDKREDLEVLWKLVKERFASSKPKNFSDDFLLTTLRAMFEKPDVQA